MVCTRSRTVKGARRRQHALSLVLNVLVAKFEVWIAKNRSDQARVVMHEGELIFNGATAGVIMKLVGEWNRSRS